MSPINASAVSDERSDANRSRGQLPRGFHWLEVLEVRQETRDACSVQLEIPPDLLEVFRYTAGQYLTVMQEIDGELLRRPYSLCMAPQENEWRFCCKRLPDGRVSGFLNSELKCGDQLAVMEPSGRFGAGEAAAAEEATGLDHIVGIAGGSGITPIMSIAETVLSSNVESRFVLVFGNQSPDEVMYDNKIKELQQKYTNRFFVQHVFSRTPGDDALFGRIETSTVNFVLKNKFKDTIFDVFYLCGPEAMIDTVSDTLRNNGVIEEKILFELFTSDDTADTVAENLDGQTQVEVLVDDETFHLTMDKKQLVLDAVLKEKIDAPYSCQGGVCSSCIARVVEGKVEMVKNQILTDGEVADGLVLTCQSHPLTPNLKIDYDDV